MADSFGADSEAREVVADLNLAGRRAVVTGASGGLGAETAAALAGRGASVTLAARNVEKAESVANHIREETPNADIEVLALELDEPKSVRALSLIHI